VVALRNGTGALRAGFGSWSDVRVTLALVGAIGVLGIAAFAWIYGAGLTYFQAKPLRSDGVSYYVYLPAVVLDHDVTLQRTIDRSFEGDPTAIGGVQLVSVEGAAPGTKRPLDPHGVGVAVLELPFFLAGHALAVVSGAGRNGFSTPYQAAAALSGLAYFLLGLVLLAGVLGRWFSRGTVVVTLLGITFGAGVFHYATYDATYSHVYSFFLVALILRLTVAVWERPRLWVAAALGAAIGLLGLVRLTNLVILVFPALIGIQRLGDLRTRVRSLARHVDLVSVGAAVCILTLLPQFAYLYRITGKVFVDPYAAVVPPAHLDLLDPHFVGVLFSVRKGLFFWTPLLLIAVAGVFFLRRTASALFVPTVAYLLVVTWVVASWSRWWYDGAFGMRGLTDAMPVFALGLAAICESARGPRPRRLLAAGIVVTTLLAVHGMVAYWLKAIPYDQTTFRQYLDSFVDYRAHTWHLSD
jgi:hypothetical protein